jgi:hypothetical protein
LPAGQKIILLVDGNVDIDADIETPLGSFFFLVTAGDITFAPAVKQAQGLFLAQQTLSTGSGNQPFEGQGTFYGGAVKLARQGSLSTQPAEKFLHRPDFWFNAPSELLLTSHVWEELVP